jgi:molybdopterin/thiamine biosynthesis adenylyltransferase
MGGETTHSDRIRDWLTDRRVVVVGLGGVGTHLVFPLARFLFHLQMDLDMVLVDGDDFTLSNATRQAFKDDGLGRNKAYVIHEELAQEHEGSLQLCFDSMEAYVKADNIEEVMSERDVVFCCVDNHATRKLLSDHAQTLNDVVLVSGGNEGGDEASEGTQGNVQLYIRKDGNDLTNAVTAFHPEIDNPEDKNPSDLSCEEAAAEGTPQILFANMTVAVLMANAFFAIASTGGEPPYEEDYFDIIKGKARPVKRPVEQPESKEAA